MGSPITSGRLTSLMSRFGETGTYTPNGGGASTVFAVVSRGARELENEFGQLVEAQNVLTFKRSDLDAPAESARWVETSSGDTWLIGQVVGRNEDTVSVEARLV